MNSLSRHSLLSIAAAVLLALLVGWASHARVPSVPSPESAAGASFGHWFVETVPTPEAGFARHSPTVGG